MSLTVRDNAPDFMLAPEGLHIARCYAVIDLGIQVNQHYGNTSPKVLIGWELMDSLMDNGQPFIHMQRYTASLNEKSNLRALLEGWRGKAFTQEELQGFKLKSILGATCYLTTKHQVNPKHHKRWSAIISICRLPLGVTCAPAYNQTILFDLDDYTEAAYLSVPENIRKKINLTGVADVALSTAAKTSIKHPMAQAGAAYPPFIPQPVKARLPSEEVASF